MLLAGDETGRTQQGNNNAYCQDNAISWHDWDITPEREALLDFVRRIIALRRDASRVSAEALLRTAPGSERQRSRYRLASP